MMALDGIPVTYAGNTEVLRADPSTDWWGLRGDSLHHVDIVIASWKHELQIMSSSLSIPTATLRRLSAEHDVDPRSIMRELREPESVRGMAGERARKALSAYQAAQAAGKSTAPHR